MEPEPMYGLHIKYLFLCRLNFFRNVQRNSSFLKQMGNEIGRGGFGLVFTALDVDNGEFVAVKRVPIDNIDPECMKQLQVKIKIKKTAKD